MGNIHEIVPPSVSQVTETLLYSEMWKRMPNRSFVSQMWLREFYKTPLWKNCFCHVLPVKDYPMFRFYVGNIVLVTPGELSLYSQCTPESRIHYALEIEEKTEGRSTANWQGIEDLKADLVVMYKRHFPVTYKGIIGYRYSLEEQQRVIGKLNKEFWEYFK